MTRLFGSQVGYSNFDQLGMTGDMQGYAPLISMGMMMLQSQMNGQGMVPLQFFGRTNAYEQLENLRYYQTGLAATTASRGVEADAHAKLTQ